MIIFAVQDDFGWISTGDEINPITLEFTEKDTIDAVVARIYRVWVNNPGNIDCLFLCAHGNSGILWIGDGLGKNKAAKFALLKGTFSANSRGIEIHGCACASPTDIEGNSFYIRKEGTVARTGAGYDFLKSMAVNSGIKTTAPFQSISGWRAARSYIGVDTLTVNPNTSSYIKTKEGGIIDDRGASGNY